MVDVKYVKSPFCITKLCDFKCISILLKNNVKIYGSILSSVLYNRKTLYKFLDNGGLITGWCLHTYKDIIERDLFKYIVKSSCVQNVGMRATKMLYILNVDDLIVQIQLVFLDETDTTNSECLARDCGIFLDSELLQLDRLGLGLLYIPEVYTNCPNPFYTICRNIEEKRLYVLDTLSLRETYIIDLYSYITQGWRHNSVIKKVNVTETRNPLCSACGNIITEDAYQLPCLHLYHKHCWRANIDFKKKCNDVIECKACEYSNKAWKLLC